MRLASLDSFDWGDDLYNDVGFGPKLYDTAAPSKPKLSIESALSEAARIKALAEGEASVAAEAQELAPLLKATVKFQNMRPRSWKKAVETLWLTRTRIESDATELIESFTKVFVRALQEAPTAIWAVESLSLLLDKEQALYHNEARHFKGSSSYDYYRGGLGTDADARGKLGDGRTLDLADLEEGAVFLQEAAMRAFFAAGGDAVGLAAIRSGPPVQLMKKLLGALRGLDVVVEEAKALETQKQWASAAIEVVMGLPEETLLSSCDDVLYTKDELDRICKNVPELEANVLRMGRHYSLVMLRSTNLQSRRNGASEITDMGANALSQDARKSFSHWLAEERVLEELFGDRLDERVLEKIELLPLIENTAAGLRPLLKAVYPQLGRPVVHTLLYNLCVDNYVETAVVVELLVHAQAWLKEQETEAALQFAASFFSMTSREMGTKNDRRIWTFMEDESVLAGLEVVMTALLLPETTQEQRVALEVALEDAKNDRVGDTFRRTLLERLRSWIADAGKVPVAREVLLLLLRLLQSYPFARLSENDTKTCRQQVVDELWKDGFCDVLWKELGTAVRCSKAVSEEDLALRLRVFAYVHRCSPSVQVDVAKLSELKDLLADRPNDFFYFLRIASVTAPHSPVNEGSFPVLAPEALQHALAVLNSLASEAPLSMAGYFCLQNAIVLVNGSKGVLSVANDAGKEIKPDEAVAMAAEALPEEQCKGRKPAVGDWVKITTGGRSKDGLLSKYDPVDEDFVVEYIDESTHTRDLSRYTNWQLVPPVMEQLPRSVFVLRADSPEMLEGVSGLWATVFHAPAEVADRAARFLLALHDAHSEVFLGRVLTELAKASGDAAGRGVMLLQTMVTKSPPQYCVQRAARGFPVDLWVTEMTPREWKDKWGSAYTTYQKGQRVVLRTHSQMSLASLQAAAAAKLGHRAVSLSHAGGRLPSDSATVMEAGLAAGTELEATPKTYKPADGSSGGTFKNKTEPTQGPLDGLGSDEKRMKSLMGILIGMATSKELSYELRLSAWMLLKKLPVDQKLEERVALLDEDWSKLWALPAKGASLWRGVYAAHVVEALLCPSDADSPQAKNAGNWRLRFVSSSGFSSLLDFLLDVCGAAEATSFEAARALPVLLRTVNACVDNKGQIEAAATKVLERVPGAVRAVLQASTSAADEWDRLRLIYATGDGLHLLQSAARACDMTSEVVPGALDLCVELAHSTESVLGAKVYEVLDVLFHKASVGSTVFERLTHAIAEGTPPFYNAVLKLIKPGFPADVSVDSRRAFLRAVAELIVSTKADHGIPCPALLRLLQVLLQEESLQGSSPRVTAIEVTAGPIQPRKKPSSSLEERLMDKLLRFLFAPPPAVRSSAWPQPSDEESEAAAAALMAFFQRGSWEQKHRVFLTATSYLAETPVPDRWDFETPKPVNSSYSLGFHEEFVNTVRNKTGYMGLLNRGNTCYMNSTMQQLFLCNSFRSAVLEAEPPLPLLTETEPSEPDTGEVLRQVQRLFWFMQESESGVYITDPLVKACKSLRLEFPVEKQNDASEFFDKLCDRLDETVKSDGSKAAMKPSAAFRVHESRNKRCLWCGFQEKTREQQVVRVTLTVKENETEMQSLEECLEAYTATETMAGDNRVQCDGCNRKADTTYQTYFTQLPQVLALQFARMTFDMERLENVKLNHRVSFPIELDMAPFTEAGKDGDAVPGCRYRLCGVQIHSGGAGGGHYYSYAKTEDGWFEFNDAAVSEFNLDNLEQECFGGLDDRGWERRNSAYMLFYRCCDEDPYGHGSEKTRRNPPLMTRLMTRELTSNQKAVARLRNAVFEEISSVNSKLYRHRTVFSAPMIQLLFNIAQQASSALPLEEDLETDLQKGEEEEAVVRFAAKAYIDVVLHAHGGKRLLKEWTAQVKGIIQAAPRAALWLLTCFGGRRDEGALGRCAGEWTMDYVYHCRDATRRAAFWEAIVTTAEVVACQAKSEIALQAFVSHLIRLMPHADTAGRAESFGELWECLTQSDQLLKVLATQKQPLVELLLHYYLGAASSVSAPPAPQLHARTEAWSELAGEALLVATGRLASFPGVALPIDLLGSTALWRALASRNPSQLAEGMPLRKYLPKSVELHLELAQTVAAKLRPTGIEDKFVMQHYRTALVTLLSAPPQDQGLFKLALVMQHALKVKDTAEENKKRSASHSSGFGGRSDFGSGLGGLGGLGGRGGGGFKRANAEAVQLLRVLQAVAMVATPSGLWSQDWTWALIWLSVAARKASSYEGVDVKEAQQVLEDLQKVQAASGHGGAEMATALATVASDAERARSAVYLVFGAGSKDANGKYAFDCMSDEGMPIYANDKKPQITLYKASDQLYPDDSRWVIEDCQDASSTPPRKLYYTQFREDVTITEPPSDSGAWMCSLYGDLPAPTVIPFTGADADPGGAFEADGSIPI